MPGCSVQWKMNKNTHGYMTVWYNQGYLCKFCELFCGHSSSTQECVTVGINLGRVWLLFYYWTSKLIDVLLSPSFPNSHHLRANFPNYKGLDPRYKWVEKSLACKKHVGFNALCTKQIGFKALVISKSFSSLLIGCIYCTSFSYQRIKVSFTKNLNVGFLSGHLTYFIYDKFYFFLRGGGATKQISTHLIFQSQELIHIILNILIYFCQRGKNIVVLSYTN